MVILVHAWLGEVNILDYFHFLWAEMEIIQFIHFYLLFWRDISFIWFFFQLHQITRRSVPTLARWNCVRSCPSDHRVSRYWYGHYFWPTRCQRSQKSLCTVHRHGIFVPWKSHTKNLSSICITHCQLLTEIFLHSWCTYELPIDTIRLVLNLMEGSLSIFQLFC